MVLERAGQGENPSAEQSHCLRWELMQGSHSQGVGIRTCPCCRGAESTSRDETNPAPQAELFGTAPGLGVHGEGVVPPFGRARPWWWGTLPTYPSAGSRLWCGWAPRQCPHRGGTVRCCTAGKARCHLQWRAEGAGSSGHCLLLHPCPTAHPPWGWVQGKGGRVRSGLGAGLGPGLVRMGASPLGQLTRGW